MRSLRPFLLLLLLVLIVAQVIDIFRSDQIRQREKADLVELSAIKYGLFNIDEWKEILAGILERKIAELDFSPDQREDARVKIEDFLTRTITDFENRFYEEKSSTLMGLLQSSVAWLTGTFEQMKKDVPVFTQQILNFLAEQENREKIKGFLMDRLDEYAEKTFAETDYSRRDAILERYHYPDLAAARSGLAASIAESESSLRGRLALLLVASAILALLFLRGRQWSGIEMTAGIAAAFALLAGGLSLPMIEIDARLSEMRFTLLGEPIVFTDQVLYYRSKSILQVVVLMLGQGKADIMAVGFLVLLFSVLFPVAKLVASLARLYRPALDQQPVIRFLVFRTGKWSMADVMVVAIFMAYIGFSGILTEQLRQLERMAPSIDIVATNQSALQSGFFLFTAFVIVSLVLAQNMEPTRLEDTSHKTTVQ